MEGEAEKGWWFVDCGDCQPEQWGDLPARPTSDRPEQVYLRAQAANASPPQSPTTSPPLPPSLSYPLPAASSSRRSRGEETSSRKSRWLQWLAGGTKPSPHPLTSTPDWPPWRDRCCRPAVSIMNIAAFSPAKPAHGRDLLHQIFSFHTGATG